MLNLEQRAERLIAEAVARGELQGLPGEGRRLHLDDDWLIPADMRLAYRVLRNAGFVPEGVTLRTEIAALERELDQGAESFDQDRTRRDRAMKRLALLRMKLESRGAGSGFLHLGNEYWQRVLNRLGDRDR